MKWKNSVIEKLALSHLDRKFHVFMTPENYLTSSPKFVISPSPLLRHVFSLHGHSVFTKNLLNIIFPSSLHNCEYLFFSCFYLPNVCANLIYSSVLFAWTIFFYLIWSAKQYSVMKQQFIVTHQYTVLQETGKPDQSSTDQPINMLCFYENVRKRILFLADNILTKGVV